jgi:uncharacterized protein YbjT (DUF2867 family)
MKNTTAHQVLVLGATGKTGSRVAERLSAHEVNVRTAARSGADARFDWDNQATWEQTLRGATGLTFLQPVDDEIVVPAGDGAEAFVSVEDIAAVAAVTLTEPGQHAGRAYAPTGPQALTMAGAAAMISAAAGRTITYRDTDREQWIAAMVSTGIPAEYAAVMRPLTATVATGNGARPNSDVLKVTGTAPVTFAEFAARTAPAWK